MILYERLFEYLKLKMMQGRRIKSKNVNRFVSSFENIPQLFSLLVASYQNL